MLTNNLPTPKGQGFKRGLMFLTPKEKASFQKRPHCLYKHFRHSEPLLYFTFSFILVWEIVINQVHRCQPAKMGLSKDRGHLGLNISCDFLLQSECSSLPPYILKTVNYKPQTHTVQCILPLIGLILTRIMTRKYLHFIVQENIIGFIFRTVKIVFSI